MDKVVWCELHRCYEAADDLIDFLVSPDWGRFYASKGLTPTYPQLDGRPELVRRIDEGVAQAMKNIEADMRGEAPSLFEVPSPNYDRDIEILSARVDYFQVALAELRQRQKDRDSMKTPKKKGFDLVPSP